MELIFLIALLAVVVWLNRGMFGFGGSEWMRADDAGDDGAIKWMCSGCGRQISLDAGKNPPKCDCKK